MMRSDKRLFQPVYALAIFLLLLMKSGFGLNSSISGASWCIERERQALLAFKQGVIDDSGMLSGWGSEGEKKDCCNWRGVHCSNTTGHVTMVDLHRNIFDEDTGLLQGNLSSSLFELHHLINLDLGGNWLDIHIPKSIHSLKKLKHLDLSWNILSGPFPSQLGNLTSLESLDLSHTYFGSVENLEWLSHLSSLKYLNMSTIDLSKVDDWLQVVNKLPYLTDLQLSRCNLQGPVPPYVHLINTSSLVVLNLRENNLTTSTFKWLFKFSHNLVGLDLSENKLQGLIPEALGNMTSLEILNLGYNELEGGIPQSFGNLCRLSVLDLHRNNLKGMLPQMMDNLSSGCLQSSLRTLDISSNQITGWLSDLIGNFSSLKYFYLYDNKLSGNLTKSIGLLSNLEELYMSSNNFSGVITKTHFSKLSKLETLDLSSNHFSIKFSPGWSPPFQLDWMNLGSCMLGPEFPKWIETQRNLSFLNISHGGISGNIPKWFWRLSSRISSVDLSFNKIYGTLPDLSGKFQGYPGIRMSSNYLEGPLTLLPTNVTSIDLSNNSFSGSVSSLCTIIGGFLEFLDVSNNQFSGELPYCLNRWPKLKILNLANNHFYGKIPDSIGSLSGLASLSLRNNSLVGEVPQSLGNCRYLEFVDLSVNKFSGMIPFWIGVRLSSLSFLLLKSNTFHGGIPLQLCRLTNIQLLDLSDNSLSGNIPWCIHNMTALTKKATSVEDHGYRSSLIDVSSGYLSFYADTTSIIWKGTGFEFHNIKNLSVIDFSSNKLAGPIPAQMWSLIGLVQLNLSRNRLTGGISPDMMQMQQLNSLDLSRNQLFSQLPQSMFQLTSLGVLDVSYNNFSGRVPLGSQFYESTSFLGNPGLCGLALNLPCPGDEKPNNNSTDIGGNDNKGDEGGFWTGFKPSIEIGAAIGFVGVLAIRLDHPWKHLVPLLLNKLKAWLNNFKDCLYLLTTTLAFLGKENAEKLPRKFKFQEPPSTSS